MKKQLIYMLLIASLSYSTFATSDIQIFLGAQLDFANGTEATSNRYYSYLQGNYIYSSSSEPVSDFLLGCQFGILNYNLWNIASGVVSIGFMESLSFGVGNQTTFEFCIGPALGFGNNNIIKLQLSPGLSCGACTFDGESYIPIGFYVDVQLKFIPMKRLSPVFGIRYDYNDLTEHNSGEHKYDDDNRVGIYLALSINIGNKKKSGNTSVLYGSGAVKDGTLIRKTPIRK